MPPRLTMALLGPQLGHCLVPENNSNWRFGTLVCRGMLNDLLGERDIALDYYTQSLRQSGTPAMQHTQFGLLLDRAWALHLARGAVAGVKPSA